MAEQADAADLKSAEGDLVRVRFPSAPFSVRYCPNLQKMGVFSLSPNFFKSSFKVYNIFYQSDDGQPAERMT